MYTQVKVAGRPLHLLVIAYPMVFYVATLAGHALYAQDRGVFWFRFGHVANWAGLITALLAGMPGFIEWQLDIPRRNSAKLAARLHMLLNLGTSIVFAANVLIQDRSYSVPHPLVGVSVLLPAIGLFLAFVAGVLGWRLAHEFDVEQVPLETYTPPSARPVSSRPSIRIRMSHGVSAA
jgi:uncharacterized membrane protein